MLEHRICIVAPLLLAACQDDGGTTSTATSATTTTAATDDTSDETSATGEDDGDTTSGSGSASTGSSSDAESSGSSSTSGSGSGEASSGSSGESGGAQASPGCGSAETPDVASGSIVVDGTERTFVFVPPTDYDPDTAYPLVFGFHGAYDSGAGARNGYRLEEHWDGEAIVVYPDGLPHGGVPRWESSPGSADHDFVLALRDAIAAQMCVDEARVFSFGYSSGGYMTNALACAHGDLFRGAGPMAGGLSADECSGPVAIFSGHGEADTTVPFSAGLAARDRWLEVNGCSDTSTPTENDGCVSYDDCAEGYPVVWCTHPGAHQFIWWTAREAVEMFRDLPY